MRAVDDVLGVGEVSLGRGGVGLVGPVTDRRSRWMG